MGGEVFNIYIIYLFININIYVENMLCSIGSLDLSLNTIDNIYVNLLR